MKEDKVTLHANAINLARRWSEMNENDLVMEEYLSDTNSKKLSKEECQNLAPHMLHPNAIPKECRKYADVMQYLKRHDTDTAHPTQWMS